MTKVVFVGVLSMFLPFSVIAYGSVMGLPTSDPWFDILVLYMFARWFFLSVVNGMPEPDERSSSWYIWAYRSLHSMAHVATAYFSHKALWRFMQRGGNDPL